MFMKFLVMFLITTFSAISIGSEITTFSCSGVKHLVKQNEITAFEQSEFTDLLISFTNIELANKNFEICRTISGKHECLNKVSWHYQSIGSLVGHVTELKDGSCKKQ